MGEPGYKPHRGEAEAAAVVEEKEAQQRRDAEALQARLEEKRRAQEPETDIVLPEGEEVPEPTKYKCNRCGGWFELDESQGGNVSLAVEGTSHLICRECWVKERNLPHNPEARTPTAPDSVLQVMDAIGINVRRHGRLTIDGMSDGPAKNAATAFVKEIFRSGRYGEVHGIYLWGPVGTGKSQLAVSIVRRLIAGGVLNDKNVIYDRARSMVTQLQDRYTTGRVDEFSERRKRALLWIYEDAGTEKNTPDAFRVVEDIIDRREGCPTIITSNLNRPGLVRLWETMEGADRFRSRLAPLVPIQLAGKDRRFTDA